MEPRAEYANLPLIVEKAGRWKATHRLDAGNWSLGRWGIDTYNLLKTTRKGVRWHLWIIRVSVKRKEEHPPNTLSGVSCPTVAFGWSSRSTCSDGFLPVTLSKCLDLELRRWRQWWRRGDKDMGFGWLWTSWEMVKNAVLPPRCQKPKILKFYLGYIGQYLVPVALRNAEVAKTFVGAVGEHLGPFILVHRVESIVLLLSNVSN